ncbi:MAG: CBS domain-containing protein [Saprospiraceae bacterium]|nr:CBS domain-containing protein [Saprospiraceae bacterium]
MLSNRLFIFKRGFNDDAFDNILVDVKLNNYKVKSIMIKGLGKLDVDDRINVALDVFKKNLFHALPVLENDRIVGIITTHDIIKNLAEDNSAINEYEK